MVLLGFAAGEGGVDGGGGVEGGGGGGGGEEEGGKEGECFLGPHCKLYMIESGCSGDW